ncbi:MacS family sensor histidine kinase [Nocardioides sp. GCM10027113]|uniref:MacS family sensor histidine kinase n=1 Tax=unclassified Nocardioides TaxID=2615069 RepID=UPI003613CFE8
MTPPPAPAAVAVEDRLFRALAVLRVVLLVNAVALNLYRAGNFDRPAVGVAMVVAMAAWTGFVVWAYADHRRRTPVLLAADLAVAVALLAASPWAKGPEWQSTVPGFWVMGALLAWSLHWRWAGGLAAAVLLAGTDLLIRDEVTQTNYGNVFLLLIGGPIVGFMAGSLQAMATERDAAERAAAAAEERARLARAVHDGVLQVLALVQRRGADLGPDGAELGRLAGEQESALRALVSRQSPADLRPLPPPSTAPSGLPDIDLAAALTGLGSARVSVAVPGDPVLLPADRAAEVVAVVEACLDNVERHVGPGAPAWVLLEAYADRVEVSVRDEGPGIPEGRLEAAEVEGRLGVSESIRGRVRDLGGTAALSTGQSGTEWELTVPRADRP